MKKVLVTGGTGFVGRHALTLLAERGWEVHAVSSASAQVSSDGNVYWHQADLFESAATHQLLAQIQPQALLHLAWCSTAPGGFWTSPLNFRWVGASLELLRAFQEQGGQRAVLAGTCAEYDWSALQIGDLCREFVTPLQPHTPYGVCKDALHSMLEAWSGQTGVSAAWGRVFMLYGPHEHPNRLVSSVIRSLLTETPAHCSPGLPIRDFLHVHDVASAFVALLESEVEGAVNIGSGTPVAIKDVALTIGELIGHPELIELGALPAQPGEPPFLVADVKRLGEEVGWQPDYNLLTGLGMSIEWWQQMIAHSRSQG